MYMTIQHRKISTYGILYVHMLCALEEEHTLFECHKRVSERERTRIGVNKKE